MSDHHRTPLLREVAEEAAGLQGRAPTMDEISALGVRAGAALSAEPQELEARVYRREAIAHHRHLRELHGAVVRALLAWDLEPGARKVRALEHNMESLRKEVERIEAEPPIDPRPADQALGGNALGEPIRGES